jgi:hypothetical protein
MTDNTEYNAFTNLPDIPYNIVSHLIDNNDTVFKLLKYNDPNAWRSDGSHPNLTSLEKGVLVYDGIKDQADCRIFLDSGADDSVQSEISMVRISVAEAIPTNYVWGYLAILCEIYCHYKVNSLSNYKPRDLMIAQSLLSTLNGADITGLGKLFFDSRYSSNSKMYTMGLPPFKFKALVFCSNMLG